MATREDKRSILHMSDEELEAIIKPLLTHEGEVTDEDLIGIARGQKHQDHPEAY